MVSCLDDWIQNPLGVIDRLYEENDNITGENVREWFSRLLVNKTSFVNIPSLNDTPSHELPNGSLVHFRCMVQDMFDPEFFLGKYTMHHLKTGTRKLCCGLYRDLLTANPDEEEVDFDAPGNQTVDRQILYCIPIPGENVWAKEMYSKLYKHRSNDSLKDVLARPKRSVDADDDENETSDITDTSSSEDKTKRSKCSLSSVSNGATTSSLPDLNFPLSSEQGSACILKIYDSSCCLKLNDMIDVVGILSADPSLVIPTNKQDSSSLLPEFMEIPEEMEAHNPPPSLVPRIHAIVVNNLSHNNPFLQQNMTAFKESEDVEFGGIREQILAILEQMLLGDRLAAEYLLCHLISSVYHRQDVVVLGKFSLNLGGCPADEFYISQVYNVVSSLVTKSHILSLSLANMNTLRFVPRKDYKQNRLQTGMLQLCARTHLVVDETALEAGQLDANGVNNMTALGNVISWQKLDYDFDFHKQTFTTDVVTLVLSEGKSILKCDCYVPLLPSGSNTGRLKELFEGIFAYLTQATLNDLRTYLGKAQLSCYSVSSEMQKMIEEDFVQTRKGNQAAMTVDDFHALLTLTRLLSLTYGKTCPTEDIWTKAKLMEDSRKERIRHLM